MSNGIAPITVKTTEEADHYPTTFISILLMQALTVVLLGCFRLYIFRLNKKRDEIRIVDTTEAAMTAFLDMTDRKNQNFRFHA